jgi:acyl-CoA synthetase (AMP-forming)/AMP-acid ligase II
VIGGSACPPAMITAFNDDYGVEVLHAWGMTEMSPLGTLCTLKNKHLAMSDADKMKIRLKQGRAIYGVDMKIVGDDGKSCPGTARPLATCTVKGPWIVREYFKGEGGDPLVDGWFPTGDVATIDPDGYMQITDRSKDVIKSGGEWISSIDIENIAMAHPAWPWPPALACRTPSGTSAPSWPWSKSPALKSPKKSCWRSTRARLSPNGRCRTMWCLSMPSRWVPRARCSRPACARCSRTTSCPGL